MATFSKMAATLAAAAVAVVATPAMASTEHCAKPVCPQTPVAANAYNGQSTGSSFVDLLLYYVPNRALDLVDIGRANVGIGCGWGVNVRATELAEIGYGKYDTTRFGMKGRVMPVYDEHIDEAGIGFLGYVNGCLQRDPSEVGADLHLGIVGAQVAVSLMEAVDFATGIILIDLQGDDLGPNPWD